MLWYEGQNFSVQNLLLNEKSGPKISLYSAGLNIILSTSPPLSRGLEIRKEIKGGKREKEKNWGKYNSLAVPNHKKLISKTQFDTI